MAQSQFLLFAFVAHHVRRKSMTSFDFPATSQLKSLLSTGMRFHFRHNPKFCKGFIKYTFLIFQVKKEESLEIVCKDKENCGEEQRE